MVIEEKLITFDTAKLAKEKQFNVPVIYCHEWTKNEVRICKNEWEKGITVNWNSHTGEENGYCVIFYSAPTQSLLQRWLREVHNIHIWIEYYTDLKVYDYRLVSSLIEEDTNNDEDVFETHEEALEIGLQEALKLLL